ncbi:ArnT family glycosyltransferase [Fuscibacter oryzae]|uniref:Glycosyltransferase family 39 protein n=1 Tax=Fuscibacter oryzae TaxID=2803939 RepID=A0A8J7SU49_9RHOB|nr:glycosyltransferase family 39 protein [Fuscibacter oryzae]MBL4928127.1 glycosyltransferase family 39 protein [Fuscibacter oryzae]
MAAVWAGWRAPVVAMLVMLVMLVLALPGFFSLPPIDRDEARFAQSSAQMLASGDLIDIRLGDEPRYKKPVGIYWLQAAVAGLTGQGESIWAYRLVSLIGAVASVGLTVGIARRVMGEGPALLAGVMLASSFLLGGEARLAKTDAMQLATILAAQAVLARAFLPGGRNQRPDLSFGAAMGFWVAVGSGILIKGPITPLVALFTVTGLCIHRRDTKILRVLRPVWGLLLVLAMVAPWLIAITFKSGGAFWAASVGQDMLAKVGQGQESHGAPPGTYLALVWATFWPGSALLVAALPALWHGRRQPVMAFAFGWIVPVWLMFELTATKLIHYVLPAYPALAILVAWGLSQAMPGRAWRGIGALVAVAVPGGVLVALWVGAGQIGAQLAPSYLLGAAGLALAAPLLAIALWRGAVPLQIGALAGAGLALSVALFPTLARIPTLWPAVALADAATTHPDCRALSVGYEEPSALFLTQGKLRFATPETLGAELAKPGCVFLAVEARAGSGLAVGLTLIGEFSGMNLGNGRKVDLSFYLRP